MEELLYVEIEGCGGEALLALNLIEC